MKHRHSSRARSLLVPSASAIALSFGANTALIAQEDETPTFELEEIVVTATKREESLQTVGLSVTALSGVTLEKRGSVEFEDFAIAVPNLAFGATDDGVLANRTITIRGIAGLNTTGFYIDDIPLDESLAPLVLDLERVEVLRGPQGTLFGARGLGGTVRLITKQPEFDDVTGKVHATLSGTQNGGFNYLVDGSVNVPLSDKAAVRLTAYIQDEEGIFDRVVGPANQPGNVVSADTPGAISSGETGTFKNVDDRTIYGGQASLRIAFTDQFEATARVFGQKTELDGFPLADFVFDRFNPPAEIRLTADDFTQERLFNVDEGGTDEFIQASLTLKYDTDFGTFISSTGYFDRQTQEFEDTSEFISFTLLGDILGPGGAGLPTAPTAIPSPIFQRLDFETFVEELRFVSDFEGPLQMTLGAFYQDTVDNEAFQPENIATGFDNAFSTFLGIPGGAGGTGTGDLIFTSETVFETEEIGLYGEFSYDITEKLTATVGVRYFDTSTFFTDQQSGFAAGGLNAVDVGPLVASESGFNFKGLLEYEASDSLYFYASAAEGFRIGGGNGDLPTALGCDVQRDALGISADEARTFTSDNLWNYEAGVKSQFADGRVTLNATAFYVDFSNIQQRILLGCGFDFVANIGAAESKGFEVEFSAYPADGLFVQAAAGYTDAQFTEDVPGLVSNGDAVQQVPEWTASATIDYTRPLTSEYDGFVRVDAAHVGSSISRVVDSANPRIRPSYEIVNLRIGVRTEAYEIVAFADNLFDEDAVFSDNRTLAAEAAGRPRIVRNRPLTIGLDLRYNF